MAEKYAVRIAEEAKNKIKTLSFSNETDTFAMQNEIQNALKTREKTIVAKKRVFREKEKLIKVEDEVKSQGLSTDG